MEYIYSRMHDASLFTWYYLTSAENKFFYLFARGRLAEISWLRSGQANNWLRLKFRVIN